jgi:hypothetical protein
MQQQAIKQAPKAPSVTAAEDVKLHRKCGCDHKKTEAAGGGECEECKKKRESKLQRAPANGQRTEDVPDTVYNVLQSPGHPLDPSIRRFMEPRFDHDFSRVRVHTDAQAGESAKAVNALAYTVGRDIVFGEGQYTAATKEGQQLIAHELTHTIQQQGSAGTPARLEIDSAGSPHEREAEQASAAVLSNSMGGNRGSQSAAPPMVSRADPDAVGFTIREGQVARSGVQFFPTNVTDTVVGPVTVQGGLMSGGANRLHVIIGRGMTLRRLARILLPLWTTATPFTPTGAAAPLPLDLITEDELARGLMMYNDTYLRIPFMTNWREGLRFPLPIELNGTIGTLHPLQIKGLAGTIDPLHVPLLDRPAARAAPDPNAAPLQLDVQIFLTAEPTALGRACDGNLCDDGSVLTAEQAIVDLAPDHGGEHRNVFRCIQQPSETKHCVLRRSIQCPNEQSARSLASCPVSFAGLRDQLADLPRINLHLQTQIRPLPACFQHLA